MKDKLSAFWSGFKDKWSSLAKNLRIFIITAVSVVIVAAIVLAIVLNQKGYTACRRTATMLSPRTAKNRESA